MSDAINPQHYKRLPAEAIEIIEAAIDRAPSNRDALLHGQALKYLLRCWNKNGIEDLKKAKWYLDRLIDSFNESEAEQLATGEVTGEVTVEVKPPDGWRWLELGEVMRNGDTDRSMEPIPKDWIGSVCRHKHNVLRRNKFEVGEKVVHGDCKSSSISVVYNILPDGWVRVVCDGVLTAYHVKDLAPYIEEAIPEIAGEATGEVKPPEGWRFLEVGEVIRKGDKYRDLKSQTWIEVVAAIGDSLQDFHKPTIRRNRFEVGEKVVDCRTGEVYSVQHVDGQRPIVFFYGVSNGVESKHLAPYIEEAT